MDNFVILMRLTFRMAFQKLHPVCTVVVLVGLYCRPKNNLLLFIYGIS